MRYDYEHKSLQWTFMYSGQTVSIQQFSRFMFSLETMTWVPWVMNRKIPWEKLHGWYDCKRWWALIIMHIIKWAATWQNQQSDCAHSQDSDQPGHPPSLIWVVAVRMKKAWVLSYPLSAQRRLWSDWADAQADLSLRWVHTHFVGFVTRRLKSWLDCCYD